MDGSGRCSGAFGFGTSSVVYGGDTTAISVFDPSSTTNFIAPQLAIRRTRFTGNAGARVIDFNVEQNTHAELNIGTSLFDANTTDGIVASSRWFAVTYTTIVANAISAGAEHGVFGMYPPGTTGAIVAYLDGSVVWQPGVPLLFGAVEPSRYSAQHNGCLLASDLARVTDPASVRTTDPELDAAFMPSATSPALDACTAGVDTDTDAYGNPRPVDQPGVPNVHGAYDLGAVERVLDDDRLFADGFD
jgi:hypothetical protein